MRARQQHGGARVGEQVDAALVLAAGHLDELTRAGAGLEKGGGGKVADGAALEAEQRVAVAELGGDFRLRGVAEVE